MTQAACIFFLIIGVAHGAAPLGGFKRGMKGLFQGKEPERAGVAGPEHRCAHFTDLELKIKAMQKCASDFGIESLLKAFNPKDMEHGPQNHDQEGEGNGTSLTHFKTKLEEIDDHFRQLVANYTQKASKEAIHGNFPGLDIPGKVINYSCFGACVAKAMVFHSNNTVNVELIKEQIVQASKDLIPPEFADKIIENCFNRTGLNATQVISLPQGKNGVVDAENCRLTVTFSMCLSKSAWQLCKYLQ